jgi:hypothetical protein
MTGRITKTKLKSGIISWGYVFDAGRHDNGKRRQILRKGFKTKHAAEDALHDAVGDRKKVSDVREDSRTFEAFFRTWLEQCVWQAGLAHFGSLFWPTPGTLKVWEIFIPWSSRRWECGNRC